MCLIAWNWQPGERPALLLLANRDEFHARPAAAATVWDGGHILAGRDLQAGGTWLGLSRTGRFAALTNYRSAVAARPGAPTRGRLVTAFLEGTLSTWAYLERLQADAAPFNPFNLLVFDGQQLLGFESRHGRTLAIQPGLGGVSNADFHTPWPKLVRLQQGLGHHLATGDTGDKALLALLADRSVAPDDRLPRTGLPLERERALSAAFIDTPGYGTRASSVVRLDAGRAELVEASFHPAGTSRIRSAGFTLLPSNRGRPAHHFPDTRAERYSARAEASGQSQGRLYGCTSGDI